ncbi:type I restriction enzyme S subunit [Janthinobacterium lividum]|uniref:restriction endonuclease subunit S n=1 Tax=Janthinobacterium lividum TaxID=29581 RepID=UPI003D1CEFE2
MLPNGWSKYVLGDIVAFRNGLNFTKSDTGEEIKIVGVADFKKRSKIENFIDLESIKVASKVRDLDLLKSGDILFVRSNGNKELIGRCLYFPHVADRISFSGFTIRGRVNTSLIEPEFASYLMRSKFVTDQIFLGGSGTNISNLSQEILSNIEVKIPVIIEQRKIAKILLTWDEAIRINEGLLKNITNQKLSLMQKILTGKERIGGNSEAWREYSLGDLFSERVETGKVDLPLLSITREEGVIPREQVGRKDTSNDDKTKYQKIYHGDIGYNTMRMWQGVSALSEYEGIISPAYTVLAPAEKINTKFASYLFKFKPIIFLFYRFSQGLVSDTWNLKYKNFSKIKVFIPNIQEQKKIAEIFETADEELAAINLIIKRLKEEKSALMNQLLTGRRRVHLPDSETVAQA